MNTLLFIVENIKVCFDSIYHSWFDQIEVRMDIGYKRPDNCM